MRLLQFQYSSNSSRGLGLLQRDDETVIDVTAQRPEIDSVFVLLRKLLDQNISIDSWIKDNIKTGVTSVSRFSYRSLINTGKGDKNPILLLPIDQPRNPWAFQLWGAGVTHKRSADAREEEAIQVSGARVNFYDKIYQAGVTGGTPSKGQEGAKPEIFFKGTGFHCVPHNGNLERAANSIRLSPEPEVVAFFMAGSTGIPTLVGFSGGNDFSDQGWESENPLYLTHAKVQDGMASLGPNFVTSDFQGFDIEEIQLECKVYRKGQIIMDSGLLKTGQKNMAHSLENLAIHLFNHRRIRADEVRGLFLGTSAVFSIPLEINDEISITYDSGLGKLANKLIAPVESDTLPRV